MDVLDRTVTAAVRAGYAWSVRRERAESWREVARMTGVIMRGFTPGQGPSTPAELVALLRRPLAEWLPAAADDEVLARLVILNEDDELTDATFEIGCDYTVELLAGQEDPGSQWLPGWSVHRTEQVEQTVFKRLLSGSDEQYATGRRFLVEHPAGDRRAVLTRQTDLGLPPLTEFGSIPHDRQWRGLWWPCPVCAWPMRVLSGLVRCCFPHHHASYTLVTDRLQPMQGSRQAPEGRAADGSVCVSEAVWRYIVVPGVVEVRLCDRIATLPEADAVLYPGKDLYDIGVRLPGSDAWAFTLDVKDYASARSLARRLAVKAVAAAVLVVPDYRRSQVSELRRLLPTLDITTESNIYRRVAARQKGSR